MKSKALKQQELEQLRENFATTSSAFLVEFRGVKAVDGDQLRVKIREAAGSYRVVKNTLARNASRGTSLEGLSEHFTGPTAIVTAGENAPGIAKTLVEFSKTHPGLVLKAGVVSGSVLEGEQCRQLADIPSELELRTKLAYLLLSPLQRLATVLQAPSRNLAVVLAQVAEQKTE